MIKPWESAPRLAAAIESIDHALSGSGDMNPSDSWRLRGIRRCLRALAGARADADRGALLREAARLADGKICLPLSGAGIEPARLSQLARFGLSARVDENGRLYLWISDDDPFPEGLAELLGLDAQLRRPQMPAVADTVLRRLTPFTTYQSPTQKAAVRALMGMPDGAALSVTMPTGAGKSLMFQLGVLWWRQAVPEACAVVIVPTVALAHDQARGAQEIPGLEGSCALTGDLGRDKLDSVLAAFVAGEVPLLFLSPELAMGRAARYLEASARAMEQRPSAVRARLMAVVVDEAHIIESWGRNFRPDFQRLPGLIEILRAADPTLRIILLSATLGTQARDELRRAYGDSRPMLEIDARVPRYELDLCSMPQPSLEARDDLVTNLVDRLPRPAIIYTTKVAHAKQLFRRLRDERGYGRIELFTGETSGEDRHRIVHAWSQDDLDLVVATSAFGLGIDKANVRAVVHACVPENPARWYQEVGRASRDGFQGIGLCIWHQRTHLHERDDRTTAYGQATRQWLTVDKALRYWRSLLQHNPKPHWQAARLYLDLDLEAIHADIDGTCDHTQRWNMALLNGLQRAGVIRVQLVLDDDRAAGHWRIEVLDSRILEEGRHADAYLSHLFGLRKTEIQAARADVDQLVKILVHPERGCILTDLFAAVETGSPQAEPCGRCLWCRENDILPPGRLDFGGLGDAWEQPTDWVHCVLPPGITVVRPDDPDYARGFDRLIERLARAGIEQFLVPTGLGTRCGEILQTSPVQAGFILEHQDLLDGSGWTLANFPAALLLNATDSTTEALYQRCDNWSQANRGLALVLVAPSGLRLDGRPLEQLASVRPPYSENTLDAWTLGRRRSGVQHQVDDQPLGAVP